jgi:hypothetical protein
LIQAVIRIFVNFGNGYRYVLFFYSYRICFRGWPSGPGDILQPAEFKIMAEYKGYFNEFIQKQNKVDRHGGQPEHKRGE